jgi:Fur family transcriptional regulator, ferric uptake regulator
MTVRHETEDQLRKLLNARNLRATRPRITVLQVLNRMPKPVSLRDVCEAMQPDPLDKSTVFRVLTDLAAAGILRRLELGDHTWRYERIRNRDDDEARVHMLCIDCGDISALTQRDLTLDVSRNIGPIEEVLLKGRCETCQARATG